jgi:hypothetical protein
MTRMRRRPAVGAVTCNRWPILFYIYLHITPIPTGNGLCPHPTPSQQDAHTLSFRVTSAYTSHTYSPLQRIAHDTRTHMSSFSFHPPSIRLSIDRAQAFFLLLLPCISPFSLLIRSAPSMCLSVISHLTLISVLLPYFPLAFLCKDRAAFFLLVPVRHYRIFGSCGRDN